MAYPLVKIFNSTNFIANGNVDYVVCKSVQYSVTPWTQWKADKRGVCLVSKITATLKTTSGDIKADPYETKIGTSYSNFAVIQIGENQFAVTRITNTV